MLSTVNNEPDWKDQIEIKYENIPEYIDIKEIKEESAECQEFNVKIEMSSVDEKLDLPQEYIKGDQEINGGGHENYDSSDVMFLNSSIGILDTKDAMVAHNAENECSFYQNIPSSKLVSPTSNTSKNTLKTNVNRKGKSLETYEFEHCDFGRPRLNLKSHIKIHKCDYCDYGCRHIQTLKIHINSKHTRENIHKCDYCDYESPQKPHLKSHINFKHTREKIHKCQYCDYGSPLFSALRRHQLQTHKREDLQVSILQLWKPSLGNFKKPHQL